MIGDLVQSIGVLAAGIIVWARPDWVIADPICTFVFSVIVLVTTIGILRETLHVLMEGVPRGVELEVVRAALSALPDVDEVHELHVWALTIGRSAMTVHITLRPGVDLATAERVVQEADALACARFGIHHTTIQAEVAGKPRQAHCDGCAAQAIEMGRLKGSTSVAPEMHGHRDVSHHSHSHGPEGHSHSHGHGGGHSNSHGASRHSPHQGPDESDDDEEDDDEGRPLLLN